jgi:glutathione reductase (NADPH)
MATEYDLIAIGSGTAAKVVAFKCRAAGWRVAIVDHRPYGGTCALRGCDPKKVLVGAAEALDGIRRLEGKGVVGRDAAVSWRSLMAFKRGFTDPRPPVVEAGLREAGIETLHGRAAFRGHDSLDVNGETLKARHVLIGTGATPMKLGVPGEEHVITSDQFLELEELPRRIVMVGGGFIAFEFAHIAARAGSQVTVLEALPRFLGHFDPDLVTLLADRSRTLGIDLRTETRVEGVEPDRDQGFVVKTSAGTSRGTVAADLVVHAAGRVPDLEGLNLQAGAVNVARGRLELNDYLQSVSNPAVYAAGDAAGVGPALTPVAAHDAHVAASNLLDGNRRTPD